jgi:hypothetical protein
MPTEGPAPPALTPPPWRAVLPLTVLLMSVAAKLLSEKMPPPLLLAMFPRSVLPMMVRLAETMWMPPPLPLATFQLSVLLVMVRLALPVPL